MKKVLALVLAAMMILSIAPMSVSAAEFKMTEFALGFSDEGDFTTSEDFGEVRPGADTNTAIKKDDDAYAEFGILYIWGKNADNKWVKLTKKEASNLKLDIKYTKKHAKTIKNITLSDKTVDKVTYATVKIEMINPFISTGDTDFTAAFQLTKDKSRIATYEIEGNLKNAAHSDLDSDDYYGNLEDQPVVKAKEYIKEAELYVGKGLTIYAKLFADKKYYARVTNSLKDEDIETIETYADIDEVYYLDTVNLKSASTFIRFDADDKNTFVYNADLEYIGTTADPLPWSTKYFLASKELDVETDLVEEPEGPIDGDTDEPGFDGGEDMGGDDLVPENVNDNPGTGC